jgi:hypothetical protein
VPVHPLRRALPHRLRPRLQLQQADVAVLQVMLPTRSPAASSRVSLPSPTVSKTGLEGLFSSFMGPAVPQMSLGVQDLTIQSCLTKGKSLAKLHEIVSR